MNFLDGSLFPENQDKLVITVAPYGPEWMPSDFPEDIAVTIDEQVQKAVDCYNAGATVLHVHVRELDGKGSKRLSKFNELLGRLRVAVPDMETLEETVGFLGTFGMTTTSLVFSSPIRGAAVRRPAADVEDERAAG